METTNDERLDQFQAEVDKLKLSGARADRERLARSIGIVFAAVGAFFTLLWGLLHRGDPGAEGTNDQLIEVIHASNNVWIGLFGLALILVGSAIWIRNSITSYLRYWMIRNLHEQRANTDRIVEALERR